MGTIASVLQWTCGRCNLINPTECLQCYQCGNQRRLLLVPPLSPHNGQPDAVGTQSAADATGDGHTGQREVKNSSSSSSSASQRLSNSDTTSGAKSLLYRTLPAAATTPAGAAVAAATNNNSSNSSG